MIAIDIDDTLCETNCYYIRKIAWEFPHPDGISGEELSRMHDHVTKIPHYCRPEPMAEMTRWMESDEFQEEIPLIAGASSYVRSIHEKTPVAAYVTSRPESVRLGTVRWLQKNQFPDARLMMRPEAIPFNERHRWKAEVLSDFEPDLDYIVDDSIEIVSYLCPSDVTFLLFGTSASAISSKIEVVCCPDWEHVYINTQTRCRMRSPGGERSD